MTDSREIINRTAQETKQKLEKTMKVIELPLTFLITLGLVLFSVSSFKSGSVILGWAFLIFALVNAISFIIKLAWKIHSNSSSKSSNGAGRGDDNSGEVWKTIDKAGN